ncbi:proline-rich nuclear receptor coactivator [Senna tora]|uniref:Proline-rich nuclear receptor coactivator n=1 Tax=Senna tora TaxID=362788 RepID=A0A834W9U0_9FABA|nr:proline-rich nuclear receptor coactivator [Senna tora]
MATEVLRPQDCLIERIRLPPHAIYRRRSYGNFCNHNNNNNYAAPNSRSTRKPAIRPERTDQRKRVAAPPSQPIPVTSMPRRTSSDDLRTARSSGMVREKVTILRRGESLDSKIDPSVYAGSAFAVSPSPNALPLPSFWKKTQAPAVVDDSATRDLRRLLRLE